ncbi:unnamed protein product [Rotaria sp. Silwood1]|nr:unnamed protein product [Rotaria sp. Silwood1]
MVGRHDHGSHRCQLSPELGRNAEPSSVPQRQHRHQQGRQARGGAGGCRVVRPHPTPARKPGAGRHRLRRDQAAEEAVRQAGLRRRRGNVRVGRVLHRRRGGRDLRRQGLHRRLHRRADGWLRLHRADGQGRHRAPPADGRREQGHAGPVQPAQAQAARLRAGDAGPDPRAVHRRHGPAAGAGGAAVRVVLPAGRRAAGPRAQAAHLHRRRDRAGGGRRVGADRRLVRRAGHGLAVSGRLHHRHRQHDGRQRRADRADAGRAAGTACGGARQERIGVVGCGRGWAGHRGPVDQAAGRAGGAGHQRADAGAVDRHPARRAGGRATAHAQGQRLLGRAEGGPALRA